MADKNALAEALVNDYVELGVAEKVDDTTLKSIDSDTTVELLEGDTANTLLVFVDGVEELELDYDDESFNDKLVQLLAEALNIWFLNSFRP